MLRDVISSKLFQFFNKNILSIDIGFRNIKVVEVEVGKGNEVHLKNFGITPTPRGCIKNGVINDVGKLAYGIKKVMSDNNMKSKKAKIVMSGTCIISRVFVVDRVSGRDIDELIKEAIQEYIPVNADHYQIDYKVLKEFFEGNVLKIKVFVTAVRKNIIQSYVQILTECSLQPISVDIPANSTAKFFNREIKVNENESTIRKAKFRGVDRAVFAVIDFGSETTIVNILLERVLEFNRVVLVGSTNLDAAIAQSLGKEIAEAERLKKMYGMLPPGYNANDDQIKLNKTVKEIVDKLAKQISMCFSFYQSRCFGDPIERIYIIGGGSLLKGLREYLESYLQIPVFPVGLMSIEGISLSPKLDKDKLNFLINSVGITL